MTLVGVVNIVGIANGRAGTQEGAIAKYERPLLCLLEEKRATRGYAGYWDAQSLTWETDMRLLVAPVSGCRAPHAADLGPFPFFTIESWYEEKPDRSFLIVDPDRIFVTRPPVVTKTASEPHRLGPLTVYLFDYDLARHVRRDFP